MAPDEEFENLAAIPLNTLRSWKWKFLVQNPLRSLYRFSSPGKRDAIGWNYFLACGSWVQRTAKTARLFDCLESN